MKLTKVETKKNEENVKRGKRAKRKGGQYERDIAKKFQERYGVELKRTPQSGGFAKKSTLADDFRGDITIVDDKKVLNLHIECKAHKTITLPSWISQAESDCPEGRIPIVVFHLHGTSKDFVALEYFSFFNIIKKQIVSNIKTEPPEEEEWRPVSNFEGYFVSNYGRVLSIRPTNGKGGFTPNNPTYLKSGVDSQGYSLVVLRRDNKGYSKRVHKLVAKEFIGLDSDILINHIDGNKSHNWSTNLEKSSFSKNIQHAYDTGLRPKGENIKASKLTDIQVAEIRLRLLKGEEVDSKEYNISSTTIYRISSDDSYRNTCNLYTIFKNQKSWSLPAWLRQAEEDCPKNRTPIVVFHQHNSSKDYVCLSLENFLQLVDKEKVISKRRFN